MSAKDGSTLREHLRILVRHLGLLEKSEVGCCGITLSQCHAVVEIGRRGSMNLNDLADLMEVDKSTMSRTINALVEAGLVTRALDNDDRRYVIIQLTEDGQRFFENTETGMERYYQTILSRIPKEKQEQVIESLTLLISAIGRDTCC